MMRADSELQPRFSWPSLTVDSVISLTHLANTYDSLPDFPTTPRCYRHRFVDLNALRSMDDPLRLQYRESRSGVSKPTGGYRLGEVEYVLMGPFDEQSGGVRRKHCE